MGNGIAHVFALSGYSVFLIDIKQEFLDKALNLISLNLDRQIDKKIISSNDKVNALNNIHTTTNMHDIKDVDLIVEAIPENYELKSSLFRQLDSICKKSTIFASNTSSISISKLGSETNRCDKVIGMHFMNPVPIMKLVEIIKTSNTSHGTVQSIIDIVKSMSKTPVECNDYPGFV